MTAFIETHYLPCIAYFTALLPANEVVLEKHEHYVKQSYRNRCYINTEHGRDSLTVPLTAKHGKVLITDVRIDYSQKWLNNHWRTILSAYRKAPFFEHYAGDLEKVLFKKSGYLYDLNYEILSMCLKWLKWNVVVKESLSYEKEVQKNGIDLRCALNSKKPETIKKIYNPVVYPQVFGNTFVENLSLIDLIFCSGPEAGRIVQATHQQLNNY